MHHSRSTRRGSRRLPALLTAVTAGLLVALAPAGTAAAKIGPSEQGAPVRGGQWEWEDGPMYELDDPCSVNGPWGEASEDCGDDDNIDEPSSDVPWGGPGLRVAVGRDQDDEAAEEEAQTEASGVCHGSWEMRDFEWDFNPTGPTVYTLTYECR
jgi:hypothetical protein